MFYKQHNSLSGEGNCNNPHLNTDDHIGEKQKHLEALNI